MERERVVYTVDELQEVLSVGRATASRLAAEIGTWVSPRRVVVAKSVLEEYLAAGAGKRSPRGEDVT